MKRYDLIVVGGGTAGLVSAAGAVSLGARVALAERDRLGGDCLYRGCVPTKTLVKSARVAHLMRYSEEYGIKSSGHEVDFPAVMDRMDRVIRSAGEHDDPARFKDMSMDVFLGYEASFVSPEEVSVDGRRLGARSVILATGSHSITPPVEGLEDVGYLTHVEALQLRRLPRSLIIVGSGPIGSEFAQIFARFGSKVTMISSSPLPLPKEDSEVGEVLKEVLVSEGVVSGTHCFKERPLPRKDQCGLPRRPVDHFHRPRGCPRWPHRAAGPRGERGSQGLPAAIQRRRPGPRRRGDDRVRQGDHRQAGKDTRRAHHRAGRGEPDPRDSPRDAEDYPHTGALHHDPRLPDALAGEPAGRGQLLPREALHRPYPQGVLRLLRRATSSWGGVDMPRPVGGGVGGKEKRLGRLISIGFALLLALVAVRQSWPRGAGGKKQARRLV